MEQFTLPFLFLPLLVSLRSKQMREKPHKTGCLSLHNCRCPNPKKHKLHNEIFIKKMVHMMPARLVKAEHSFHNNLKSMFGYTLEGERVWDYTCMKVFQALHSLWKMQDEEVRMWNLFVCSEFCCCFNTTHTDTDSATENNWNICFSVFPEFNWFYTFSFH